MDRRALMMVGGAVVALTVGLGTASASVVRDAPDGVPVPEQSTATATPTATRTPTRPAGGPPADRGGGRPDNAGPRGADGTRGPGAGQEGPGPRGATGSERGPGARSGGPNSPTLPEQASPRAKAAVAAAAERRELLRERLDAMKALPTGAARSEAMKAVMADFGALFRLVAEAVHSVDPSKPEATPTATLAGTATGTPTTTPTSTPTSTPTATATAAR